MTDLLPYYHLHNLPCALGLGPSLALPRPPPSQRLVLIPVLGMAKFVPLAAWFPLCNLHGSELHQPPCQSLSLWSSTTNLSLPSAIFLTHRSIHIIYLLKTLQWVSSHDKITGTRLTLCLKQLKKNTDKYMGKKMSSDIGHQAVQRSKPWEMENKWGKFYNCPAWPLKRVFRPQFRERGFKWRLVFSLSWGSRPEDSGKPGWLEFIQQNAREGRAAWRVESYTEEEL